jgi:hypothetical protein
MKGASLWLEARPAVDVKAIDADNAVANANLTIFMAGTSLFIWLLDIATEAKFLRMQRQYFSF